MKAATRPCLRSENLTMEEHDLIRSIDRGLDPFGSNTKQMIYWKMLSLHDDSSQEVTPDPEAFESAIVELLGANAVRIERSIIREIRKTFDLAIEDTQSMVAAIEAAKHQMTITS